LYLCMESLTYLHYCFKRFNQQNNGWNIEQSRLKPVKT
jgi:hypothetical protein